MQEKDKIQNNIENKIQKKIKELKQKSKELTPSVRIGKNGITSNALLEIDFALKKKHLIKVKLLPAFIEEHDKKEACEKIAKSLRAQVISMTGSIIVLYKG